MNNHQIACCYHPTTVMLVDDNKRYHVVANLAIDSNKAICQFYHDPQTALEFLKEQYVYSPFTSRCLLEEGDFDKRNIEVTTRAIRQEIYNAQRFDEISTVILDFAMPGMTGGEVAQQLKDSPFKVILLTGEADAKIAIELFNEGVIQAYIRKDDPNFNEVLNHTISDMQQRYFTDLSSLIRCSLSLAEDTGFQSLWFKEPVFSALLDKICQDNQITEYYLLDENGSYLLLDANAKPSWLIVADNELMDAIYQFAESEERTPDFVLKALKNREKIPYFYSDEDWKTPITEWEKYLHPIQMLQGNKTYYYAYITNHHAYDIVPEKIVSYKKFLEKRI